MIELLVVIAIIAVLAALLVPAVRQGMTSARRVSCVSNMRQIGIALNGFCADHQGLFPSTTHGSTGGPDPEHTNAWIYTLAPYLGDVDEIRISPGDPRRDELLEHNGTSYIMNEYIAVPLVSFGGVLEDFTNRDLLASPVRTYTTFIGAESLPADITSDHTHSRLWVLGWPTLLQSIQPDRHRSGSPNRERTDGTANYLFADAHVNTLHGTELKSLYDRDPDFARPPQ